MKCHYCGAEIAENQSYCLWCGTHQESVKEIEPEETVQEETVQEETVQEETVQEVNIPEAVPVMVRPEHVRNASKNKPLLQLPDHRGLGKMFFLGILTLCIYPTVIWSRIVTELNIAASRYDGKRTMPYFAMVMLAPFTLGIYAFVWIHKFCRRIGDELHRRGIDYKFGPSTFWLWNVLGSLIIVGPFIFTHKLMKSMNKINADFNVNG